MSLSLPEGDGPLRRERLRTARLYFVCDARPGGDLEALLRAALTGGADIVQLREKELGRADIERAAGTFRRVADTFSALFVLNDDPELARICDADGVHVGQDDVSAEQAREAMGPDAIVGLSTHSEEQIAASAGRPVDYISVGPIWETPTKAGRPGVGLELISHAAARAPTRSSRSAASTRVTLGKWWTRAPSGSARCGRSATPPTPKPRRGSCGRRSPLARRVWPPVAEERAKRKRRSGANGAPKANPMTRGYAKAEQRNQEAREALEPLGEGERPTVVTVGAVVAALISLSVVIGYATGVEVNGEQPKLPQVVAPAVIMGMMAWGMWHARYWAVLGFQLILVVVLFSAFFGLVVGAGSVGEVLGTLALLIVAGTFFFFMVKAMARIQMPTPGPKE